MKISVPKTSVRLPHPTGNVAGNILMVAVFTLAIVGALVVGCLTLVQSQNVDIARSQTWNECIPVIEAGIEEALAHLNNPADTNITSDNWILVNGRYTRSGEIGQGYYDVGIIYTNPLRPIIVCTGYVELPAAAATAQSPTFAAASMPKPGVRYITRAVQATAEKTEVFVRGMVCREKIEMNGNNITTDSFDSADTNFCSPLGLYDPTRIKDNGDVCTLLGLSDAIGVGNANIKGHLRTGPGGSGGVGSNGKVGSLGWHATAPNGIQPGWMTDDMNITFPDVQMPFKNSPLVPIPIPNIVNAVPYKYVLTNGNYRLSNLTLSGTDRMLAMGDVTLLVTDSIDVSGSGAIDILPTARLNLYMMGATATIGGLGVNNTGRSTSFYYWGLPTHTTLFMKASGDFTGAIYAPNADLKMSGGGNSLQNFVGACVVKSIFVNGHYSFHYDEALGKFGPLGSYIIVSWVEI
jgi:hypothetical protein